MRTLTPDQKARIVEEQEDQDERSIMLEDAGSIMDAEDAGSILDAEGAKMSKIYTAELPINVSGQFFHLLFHFLWSIQDSLPLTSILVLNPSIKTIDSCPLITRISLVAIQDAIC